MPLKITYHTGNYVVIPLSGRTPEQVLEHAEKMADNYRRNFPNFPLPEYEYLPESEPANSGANTANPVTVKGL